MSIKDLISKVIGMEQRAEAAFKAELESVKATINGTLTQLQADLATAQASIASLSGEKTDLAAQVQEMTGKLSESNKLELDAKSALLAHLGKIPGHEDFKEGGKKASVTLAELITAEQNATNTALAATGVKLETLPVGGAAPAGAPGRQQLTRDEFEALDHFAREKFFRTGGKLKSN